MPTPNDNILDTQGHPIQEGDDEGVDLELAVAFEEMAKALPVAQRRAYLALQNAEKTGNQAALPALRLLVDDLLPILSDLIINCGSNFEALDEVLSGEDDDEDESVEPGPGAADDDVGGPEEVEALYRTVRLMLAFLEQLVLSKVLDKKPKAKESADNLLGMLKEVTIAGVEAGFVADDADKKIIEAYAGAFSGK